MTALTIQTERLLLVACTADLAFAASSGRHQVETLLGARVPPEWPGNDIRDYLPVYAIQVRNDPSALGWGMWIIVQSSERVVVGDAGFKGKPDTDGTVDIGYGIVPDARRQGYGFEAAQGLVHWAFAQPGVRRITADCLPDNLPSVRILERLGMVHIGITDTGLLKWELLP